MTECINVSIHKQPIARTLLSCGVRLFVTLMYRNGQFLSRVSILLLTRNIDIAILSVRLSVCYCHSYCRRRIGNRTYAFEWHHFQ